MVKYRKYTICDNLVRLHNAGALSDAVHLDTNGVVCFPGGYMHPGSFRYIAGEEAYQALLARPRVQSEYTDEELEEGRRWRPSPGCCMSSHHPSFMCPFGCWLIGFGGGDANRQVDSSVEWWTDADLRGLVRISH